MSKIRNAVTGLAAVAVSFSFTAQADNHGGGASAAPVELYACTFQEGKGMDDMVKMNAKWKKWADKNMPTYSAWMIVPNFRASEQPFDVGWIGSWLNGADMGKSLDTWSKKNDGLAAAYFDILDCSHSLMSSVEINAPDGPPTDDGLVWFSSCTVDDDSNVGEAYQAHKAMGAAFRKMGSPGQSWLFYPALGAGDIKFDYYSVVSFKNYAELGAGWEMYTNKGGYNKAVEIMGGKVMCDSPRLYEATMVKNGGPRS